MQDGRDVGGALAAGLTLVLLDVADVGGHHLAAGGAQADLQVHTDYAPLFEDARAMVKSKNLLGETYVELSRGTPASGPLPRKPSWTSVMALKRCAC